MPSSDWDESIVLAEWAEYECRHLDLIASWETLLSIYEALGFQDQITDEQRLDEYKWVITELNKFLTRMRNGLSSASTVEDAIAFLAGHANTSDMSSVKTRSSIAYNKLKQHWIGQAIAMLKSTRKPEDSDEGEEDDE